jgi:broad specificity phosphatase PhoE
MGTIYLIRHGQASFGAANYDELSPLGIKQARMLGAWFARCDVRFDLVVTGQHQRHRDTARECLLTQGANEYSLVCEPGFDEYDAHAVIGAEEPGLHSSGQLGSWLASDPKDNHIAFQGIFSRAFKRWVDGSHDGDYAETWSAFRARCVAALTRIADQCERGHKVAVFTSGGPIAAICQQVLGMPDINVAPLHFATMNASVTKLLCRPGSIGLGCYNNVAHLESRGSTGAITYR